MLKNSLKLAPVKRFSRIEGLRAPLAWWVVIAHCLQTAGLKPKNLPEEFQFLFLGIVPVYGFMVLSGFVIAHLVTTSNEKYFPYIIRRYSRLAPVAILGACFAAMIHFFVEPLSYWPQNDFIAYALLYVTLFHGAVPNEILPDTSMKFVGVSWSISLEWQFYLIAPWLIAALARGKKWLLPVTSLVAISFLLGFAADARKFEIFGSVFTFEKPSFLLSVIIYFVIGVLIYQFRTMGEKYSLESGLLLVCISLFFQPLNERSMLWQIAPLLAVLSFVLVNGENGFSRLFENRILCWLGNISYSTYMLHIIIIAIAKILFAPFFDPGWDLFWVFLLVVPPATIAVSAASYYYVEKPFMRMARSYANRAQMKGNTV